MSYMNCSRCGLSVQLRASYLLLERCPRCLARRGVAVPMHITEHPPRAPVRGETIQLADAPTAGSAGSAPVGTLP
jgi:hypothetical protein